MAKKSIQEALSLPVFAENGNRTPFTNQQHAEGWETIGSTPPEATQFNDVFQTIDLIARWSLSQIITAIREKNPDFQPNDLETTNLKDLLDTWIRSVDLSKLVTLDTEQIIKGKKTFGEVWGNGGKLATESWTRSQFLTKGSRIDLRRADTSAYFAISNERDTPIGFNSKADGRNWGKELRQSFNGNWYIIDQRIATVNDVETRATNQRADDLQNQIHGRATWQRLEEIRVELQNQLNDRVQNVRFTDFQENAIWRGAGFRDDAGFGWVITGLWNHNSDEWPDGMARRRLQKLVNGVWYNVGI